MKKIDNSSTNRQASPLYGGVERPNKKVIFWFGRSSKSFEQIKESFEQITDSFGQISKSFERIKESFEQIKIRSDELVNHSNE